MHSRPTWSVLSERLRGALSPEEFATWIAPLRVKSESDDSLVLVAPNVRFVHTVEENYRTTIDRVVAGAHDEFFQVVIAADEHDEAPATAEDDGVARLNPKYLFDTFVVGASNQFAHAAARAVAESPSHSYNPLFLYGGVGLGKTHLLHAIGHRIRERHPQLTIRYLTAEQFVNQLINSIRFKSTHAFRERYRSIDVLLVDDVQFMGGKERTQEEFFHTFNALYTSQKQIILSSDTSPRNIPSIEDRLRSRFEWGLIADIQAPDLETKVAILRRKADLERLDLPDDVALFVANQVKTNVRELEGMLTRVAAFASLTGRPLSLDQARETLRDILPDQGRGPSAAEIIKFVARHYGLKVGEIKSKSNVKQISFPRQVAMYLCKQLTQMSYPEIGRQFNDKHHSTVMYSVDKIENLRVTDAELSRTLEAMTKHLT
ncbi:MAG: chromosomal replication initiator protein DnaA [Thermoanaerobaculia bacterium]|nr:MAG: chromosomal replication initiator protein DnaA [Thermoanaerobaculia bacterium]MBZ0103693.1 chromosomal replication initiator protein DnaA [Thermoanaerobaculia bacterium]